MLFMLSIPPFLSAEKITEVNDEGALVLANGGQVMLAGVECSEEGRGELAFLAEGKDARIEVLDPAAKSSSEDSLKDDGGGAPQQAYVFVRQAGLMLPYIPSKSPEIQEVMLNEILLSLGAAKVRGGENHPRGVHFKELETQAQKSGQGIWSYEPQVKRKGGSVS